MTPPISNTQLSPTSSSSGGPVINYPTYISPPMFKSNPTLNSTLQAFSGVFNYVPNMPVESDNRSSSIVSLRMKAKEHVENMVRFYLIVLHLSVLFLSLRIRSE